MNFRRNLKWNFLLWIGVSLFDACQWICESNSTLGLQNSRRVLKEILCQGTTSRKKTKCVRNLSKQLLLKIKHVSLIIFYSKKKVFASSKQIRKRSHWKAIIYQNAKLILFGWKKQKLCFRTITHNWFERMGFFRSCIL